MKVQRLGEVGLKARNEQVGEVGKSRSESCRGKDCLFRREQVEDLGRSRSDSCGGVDCLFMREQVENLGRSRSESYGGVDCLFRREQIEDLGRSRSESYGGVDCLFRREYSYFYSTTKHEIIQIKNHNLLCSLDPPNQSWLFWLLSASITRGAYMGGYLSLAPPPDQRNLWFSEKFHAPMGTEPHPEKKKTYFCTHS